MTKKDYEAIAERIARLADKYQHDEGRNIIAEVVEDLAEEFAEENPRFDFYKFVKACGFTVSRPPVNFN
jgi:hypothetical protein